MGTATSTSAAALHTPALDRPTHRPGPPTHFLALSPPTRSSQITKDDLQQAVAALGDFGGDNRAGVEGTLHRISAIRNRKGSVVGLTCRVGRAVTGHVGLIRDILDAPNSILFLGRPGVVRLKGAMLLLLLHV